MKRRPPSLCRQAKQSGTVASQKTCPGSGIVLPSRKLRRQAPKGNCKGSYLLSSVSRKELPMKWDQIHQLPLLKAFSSPSKGLSGAQTGWGGHFLCQEPLGTLWPLDKEWQILSRWAATPTAVSQGTLVQWSCFGPGKLSIVALQVANT